MIAFGATQPDPDEIVTAAARRMRSCGFGSTSSGAPDAAAVGGACGHRGQRGPRAAPVACTNLAAVRAVYLSRPISTSPNGQWKTHPAGVPGPRGAAPTTSATAEKGLN